jgi:hypothetical protein
MLTPIKVMADETVYRGILAKVRAARMDVQHMLGFLQGTHLEHAKSDSESESESDSEHAVQIILPQVVPVAAPPAEPEQDVDDRERLRRYWSAVPREQRRGLLREVDDRPAPLRRPAPQRREDGPIQQVQDTFAVFGDVLSSVEREQERQKERMQALTVPDDAGRNPRNMLRELYSANGLERADIPVPGAPVRQPADIPVPGAPVRRPFVRAPVRASAVPGVPVRRPFVGGRPTDEVAQALRAADAE